MICQTCKHDENDHLQSEVIIEDVETETERIVTTELQTYCNGAGWDDEMEEAICACRELDLDS